MQHLVVECIRRRVSEVNDLQGDFSGRMEPLSPISLPADQMAAFKTLVPVQSGVHASLSDGSQTILGTKLEHGAWECYMWITWGSPGSPDR
jgi:hypothetical protein